MHAQKYPFAVRLYGFPADETALIGGALAHAPAPGPQFACLLEDSLQEPDLLIANADDARALASLVAARPGPVRPALVVGAGRCALPFPQLDRPLDLRRLFAELALLLARRGEALAGLAAHGEGGSQGEVPSGVAGPPERRRHPRPEPDLGDPADYCARRRPPPDGAVLIIDIGGAFRDHLACLVGARKLAIEWTDCVRTAVRLCEETPVSLVLVNTSAPGIDPYTLCADIKALEAAARIAVVLLVGPNFRYDAARARAAGVRGLLDKPVADRHLVATLHRLLSLPMLA